MDKHEIETILITGANAGIGKEVARQLAMKPDIQTIYLACRDERKAIVAKRELEEATKRSIFKIVLLDLTDLTSVRSLVNSFQDRIDAVVLNAGAPAERIRWR